MFRVVTLGFIRTVILALMALSALPATVAAQGAVDPDAHDTRFGQGTGLQRYVQHVPAVGLDWHGGTDDVTTVRIRAANRFRDISP